MLAVVGVRGVGEEGQQLRDDDGEDFLWSASANWHARGHDNAHTLRFFAG